KQRKVEVDIANLRGQIASVKSMRQDFKAQADNVKKRVEGLTKPQHNQELMLLHTRYNDLANKRAILADSYSKLLCDYYDRKSDYESAVAAMEQSKEQYEEFKRNLGNSVCPTCGQAIAGTKTQL